jgi:hypothetical protein
MRGKKAQVSHGLDVQRDKVGDVVLIEGLGILSEDNITVVRGGGTRQAKSIAPEILFLFVGAAISLFFIGGAFDAASGNQDRLWVVGRGCSALGRIGADCSL